jgi:hypothetical protein
MRRRGTARPRSGECWHPHEDQSPVRHHARQVHRGGR